MKRFYGTVLLPALFLLVSLSVEKTVCAQDVLRPIAGNFLLSGNFGELRATHFHSGLDIRTGGVEGLPVLCVKDGRVARVSISPTGYGNALYVEHPDGTTSVYGHLRAFEPRLAAVVKELQYAHESFCLDEDLRSCNICYRQGDTVAFSGNTGSSAGPHLHFEIRNTVTEHPLNPLLFLRIRDKLPPVVRRLFLYRIAADGRCSMCRTADVRKLGPGAYSAGQLKLPSGTYGLGAWLTDHMDGSWNKLGVYRISVKADGKEIYRMQMDSSSFSQHGFINEIKDFDRFRKKETVYRFFGNYQKDCMGVECRDKGYVTVGHRAVVRLDLAFEDINGNRSSLKIALQGTAPADKGEECGRLLRYDQPCVLRNGAWTLELGGRSLFANRADESRTVCDSTLGREVCVLADKEVPLLQEALLKVAGDFSVHSLICEISSSGKLHPLDTRHTVEGLESDIRFLGRYVVMEDTVAPHMDCLGKISGQAYGIRVKDELSGIAGWKGEVNGSWCLFSYDPRTGLLKCDLRDRPFARGKTNTVKMHVSDRAGNLAEKTFRVNL